MGCHQWPAVLKQAYGRWSSEETDALLAAWKRLGRRGRGARTDCFGLALADWGTLAEAVNTYRAGAGLDSFRTYGQCKSRLRYVTEKTMQLVDGRGAAAHKVSKARAVAAGEKAFVLSSVALEGSATSSGTRSSCKRKRGATETEAVSNSRSFTGSGDTSGGEGRDAFFGGGSIPKRPRTGCSSTATSAAGRSRSSFVKEERAKARAGATGDGDGRGGDEATTGTGSTARPALADIFGAAAGHQAMVAAGSVDAAVVLALADAYVRLKQLDVKKEKVTAKAAMKEASKGAGPSVS